MSSGHVLGSVPPKDPMEEITRSLSRVPEDTEIRWNDRSVERPWVMATGLTLVIVIAMMAWPLVVIFSLTIVLAVFLLSQNGNRLVVGFRRMQSRWTRLPWDSDNLFRAREHYVEHIDEGGTRRVVALTMERSEPVLQGDMSRLVRGIPTWGGLCLAIVLHPERPTRLLNNDTLISPIERYLDSLSGERLNSYIQIRGGLWAVNTMLTIRAIDEPSLMTLAASVRGAVPSAYWRIVSSSALLNSLASLDIASSKTGFYALGNELDKWLIQLRTELAYEVGENVPGQFVAPIRAAGHEYRLGQVINPDTLDLGPEIGITHKDLEQGLLICGGVSSTRLGLLANIIRYALRLGKRVLVVTSTPDNAVLSSLSEQSVVLSLGRDLVLNPVDCESIPRTEYVPMFLSALETVARADLSNAPDFELAVSRAVALPGSTLADVTLEPDQQAGSMFANGSGVPSATPNSASKAGMDAVRTLYQASGAAAFYGTQSIPIERLAKEPLSVLVISLGSVALDVFAWELLCIKLATLDDKDLVVVFDGPRNLEIVGTDYSRRVGQSTRIARLVRNRVPLVLCTERPSLIPDVILSDIPIAVALRLKSRYDIAAVTDLLSLKVIGTGLHSKARESVRESSYLSVMDDSAALLVRHGRETAIPIRLDPPVPLSEPDAAVRERTIALLNSNRPQVQHDDTPRSLLDQIAGRESGLAVQLLRLLERYQPLTEEAIRRFIMSSSPESANSDVQGMLLRLTDANLILPGSEYHSGVSYRNYRLTMKGTMALRQVIQQQDARGVVH